MMKFLISFLIFSSPAFAMKEGLAGVEEHNAKKKVRADKVKAIDWDKINTVAELKVIVKAMVELTAPEAD